MKQFKKAFLKSRWLWLGFSCHVIAAAIGIAFLNFDILFSLGWANGIDGPTPLFDLLMWTLRITIPAGLVCYLVAFWKTINGDKDQHVVAGYGSHARKQRAVTVGIQNDARKKTTLTNNKNFDGTPIFIVGCGHSGTSLLLAILAEHPNIFAIPFESNIALQNDSDFFLKEIETFNALAIKAEKKRWVEKTPRHIRHIAKILNWEPKSKLVLIVRDGRDVAYSIKERTGNLKNGIQRWVSDNVAGKQYWKHPQVYLIRYEDIISDFEHSLTELLKFLGEDYLSSMKSFHTTPKRWYSDEIARPENASGENHAKYRNWQLNQPIFDGRGKWKLLSTEEMSIIEEEAGSLLLELGYS